MARVHLFDCPVHGRFQLATTQDCPVFALCPQCRYRPVSTIPEDPPKPSKFPVNRCICGDPQDLG